LQSVGLDKLELIGRIGYEILILPEDREKIIQKNKEREQKVNDQYEMIMLNKSGEKVLFSLKASPIEDFAGTVIGSMAICMDITEQKRNEAKIRNLLKEKDVLLREVHHRIKNNMSTIRAMLAFQANTINLPEAEVAQNEAENRIMSMMMIYNKLYRSQDYSKINANEYLSELVKEISSTLNHKHNIQVELSIENIVLNSEILYPLGIIVNELVTNSYKYAFPDQKQGQILINLRTKENGKMELLYADNGIGIPECRLAERKKVLA
jgi:PAS domain S-box-containing protein